MSSTGVRGGQPPRRWPLRGGLLLSAGGGTLRAGGLARHLPGEEKLRVTGGHWPEQHWFAAFPALLRAQRGSVCCSHIPPLMSPQTHPGPCCALCPALFSQAGGLAPRRPRGCPLAIHGAVHV